MRRNDHGKPRGVIPPVLRSKDGLYLIGSKRWDKPDAEWDYFQWSGGSQEAVTSLILAVYDLTGNQHYLNAAGESFEPLADCAPDPDICAQMRRFPEAFYTWRHLTGDSRYDTAFGYRTSDNETDLLQAMMRQARESDEYLSFNWDILTSEALYTDRVYYSLPAEYRVALFGGEAPRGDRYPTFAVTWPAIETEFARAVTSAGDRSLRLRLYSFEASDKQIAVRLWRLKPGRYTWEAGGQRREFTIARVPHLLQLPLSPRKDTTVRIVRAPE
jgi:hypothetical protein